MMAMSLPTRSKEDPWQLKTAPGTAEFTMHTDINWSDYLPHANNETLIVVQVETLEGMKNVEAIAAVPAHSSGAVTAAMMELEISGWLVSRSGRRYEKRE